MMLKSINHFHQLLEEKLLLNSCPKSFNYQKQLIVRRNKNLRRQINYLMINLVVLIKSLYKQKKQVKLKKMTFKYLINSIQSQKTSIMFLNKIRILPLATLSRVVKIIFNLISHIPVAFTQTIQITMKLLILTC